jgi:hypothetical protein
MTPDRGPSPDDSSSPLWKPDTSTNPLPEPGDSTNPLPEPGDSTNPLWEPGEAGVLRLPSGRLVRGRGLREPMPSGHPPAFGVYLLGEKPPEFGWESRWIRWPDFRLPADRRASAGSVAAGRR